MKAIKKLNQAGDTIIEVLIVLAILSMSFGISYATANKGLNQSLNAEEHSEALGILDTQIEDLRIAITTHPAGFPPVPATSANPYFCMTGDNSFYNMTSSVPSSSTADSRGSYSEYTSACTFSTFYHASISAVNTDECTGEDSANCTTYTYTTPIPTDCTPDSVASCSENSFTFMVRWDGVGDLGAQQESLTYRFGSVLGAGGYMPAETYVPPLPTTYTLSGDAGSCYFSDEYICFKAPSATSGPDLAADRTLNSGDENEPFEATYSIPANGIIQTDNSGYSLTLCYENITAGGSLAPPTSAYPAFDLTITDNAGSTTTPSTPALTNPGTNGVQLCNATPIQLNVTSAPSTVTLDWLNDYWSDGDANLQIDSVTLTAN